MTVRQLINKLSKLGDETLMDMEIVYRPYGVVHCDDMEKLSIVDLHEQEGHDTRVIIGS